MSAKPSSAELTRAAQFSEPSLFAELDLRDAAENWEPEGARLLSAPGSAHTGSTTLRNQVLCDKIAALALQGVSRRRIARECEVSRHTLEQVLSILTARGKMAPLKERLIRKFGQVAELCAESLGEQIEAGTVEARDLSIALGIATDKWLLLQGEANSIVEQRVVEVSVEDVNRAIAALGRPIECESTVIP